MTRLLTALLFCLLTVSMRAQVPRRWSSNGISGKKSYVRKEEFPASIAFRAGLTQFYGELAEQDMQTMIGLSLRRSFNKTFALRLDYTKGQLGGQDVSFFNAYFLNRYQTLELAAQWDLTEQFNRFEPGNLHLYMYGGLGLMYFNAWAFSMNDSRLLRYTNSPNSARNPLFKKWGKPHGPPGIRSTHEGIIPLGISPEYRFLKHWKLIFDFRFYLVRTDKADATSGMRTLNPEESESYSDTPNDKFSFITAGIGFQF